MSQTDEDREVLIPFLVGQLARPVKESEAGEDEKQRSQIRKLLPILQTGSAPDHILVMIRDTVRRYIVAFQVKTSKTVAKASSGEFVNSVLTHTLEPPSVSCPTAAIGAVKPNAVSEGTISKDVDQVQASSIPLIDLSPPKTVKQEYHSKHPSLASNDLPERKHRREDSRKSRPRHRSSSPVDLERLSIYDRDRDRDHVRHYKDDHDRLASTSRTKEESNSHRHHHRQSSHHPSQHHHSRQHTRNHRSVDSGRHRSNSPSSSKQTRSPNRAIHSTSRSKPSSITTSHAANNRVAHDSVGNTSAHSSDVSKTAHVETVNVKDSTKPGKVYWDTTPFHLLFKDVTPVMMPRLPTSPPPPPTTESSWDADWGSSFAFSFNKSPPRRNPPELVDLSSPDPPRHKFSRLVRNKMHQRFEERNQRLQQEQKERVATAKEERLEQEREASAEKERLEARRREDMEKERIESARREAEREQQKNQRPAPVSPWQQRPAAPTQLMPTPVPYQYGAGQLHRARPPQTFQQSCYPAGDFHVEALPPPPALQGPLYHNQNQANNTRPGMFYTHQPYPNIPSACHPPFILVAGPPVPLFSYVPGPAAPPDAGLPVRPTAPVYRPRQPLPSTAQSAQRLPVPNQAKSVHVGFCMFCSYAGEKTSLIRHYVNDHPDREPFVQLDADELRDGVESLKDTEAMPSTREVVTTGVKCLDELTWIPQGSLFLEPQQCKLCPFTVKIRTKLIEHMQDHRREHLAKLPQQPAILRTLFCRFCEYRCLNLDGFYMHCTIHTGEFVFACGYCGYRGAVYRDIQEHNTLDHFGKAMSVKKSYAQLQGASTVLRGYACTACGFVQLARQKVDAHVQSHQQREQAVVVTVDMSRRKPLPSMVTTQQLGPMTSSERRPPPAQAAGDPRTALRRGDLIHSAPAHHQEEPRERLAVPSNGAEVSTSSSVVASLATSVATASRTSTSAPLLTSTAALASQRSSTTAINEDPLRSQVSTKHQVPHAHPITQQPTRPELIEARKSIPSHPGPRMANQDLSIPEESSQGADKSLASPTIDQLDSPSENAQIGESLGLSAAKDSGSESQAPDKSLAPRTIDWLDPFSGSAQIGESPDYPVAENGANESRCRKSIAVATPDVPIDTVQPMVTKVEPLSIDREPDGYDSDRTNVAISEDEADDNESDDSNATVEFRPPSPSDADRAATLEVMEPVDMVSVVKSEPRWQASQTEEAEETKTTLYSVVTPPPLANPYAVDRPLTPASEEEFCTVYPCPLCQFTALVRDNFTDHIETIHPGTGPYTCLYCAVDGYSLFSLAWHIADQHGNVSDSTVRVAVTRRPCVSKVLSVANMTELYKNATLSFEVMNSRKSGQHLLVQLREWRMTNWVRRGDFLRTEISNVGIVEGARLRKNPTALQRMLTGDTRTDLFKCCGYECTFQSLDEATFLRHLQQSATCMHTPDGQFYCIYCGVSRSMAAELAEHLGREHGKSIYQCPKCIFRAMSVYIALMHMISCHSQPECFTDYTIIECPSVSVDPTADVMPDIKSVLNVLFPIVCTFDDCKFLTMDGSAFEDHMTHFHGSPIALACFLCNRQVESASFGRHLEQVHGVFNIQCVYCGFGSSEVPDMVLHVSRCHPHVTGRVFIRDRWKVFTGEPCIEAVSNAIVPQHPMPLQQGELPPCEEPLSMLSVPVKEEPVWTALVSRRVAEEVNEPDFESTVLSCGVSVCPYLALDGEELREHMVQCVIENPDDDMICGKCQKIFEEVEPYVVHVLTHLSPAASAEHQQRILPAEQPMTALIPLPEQPTPSAEAEAVIKLEGIGDTHHHLPQVPKLTSRVRIAPIGPEKDKASSVSPPALPPRRDVESSDSEKDEIEEDMAVFHPKETPFHVDNARRYKCFMKGCDVIVQAEYAYDEHLAAYHAEARTDLPCPHCPEILANLPSLVLHLRLHGPNLYSCNGCGYVGFASEQVLSHIRISHPDRPSVVTLVRQLILPHEGDQEDEQAWGQSNPRRRVRDRESRKSATRTHLFKCNHCPVKLCLVQSIKRHISSSHPDVVIDYRYLTKEQLFQCGYCERVEKNYLTLMRHLNTDHPETKRNFTKIKYASENTPPTRKRTRTALSGSGIAKKAKS